MGNVASSNLEIPRVNPLSQIDVTGFNDETINIRHIAATSLGPHYDGACLWYPDIRNNWNYLTAAVTRLCRQVPPFTAGPRFWNFVDEFLDHFDIKGPIPIIPFESYINNHPSYTAAKKRQLIELEKATRHCSLEDLWKFTTADSFLKWEPYPEEKKPRLINPRSDAYKVRVAHIHASVDKFLYEKLADFLVKGMTSPERTRVILERFNERINISSSDFTSQENSIKQELMTMECTIYQRLLKGAVPDETLNLIVATKLDKQRLQGSGLKIVLDVTRDSGDPDTASMNVIENIISTLYSYYEQLYQDMTIREFLLEKGHSYDILCEGDDGIHSSTRGRIDSSTYEQLGFIAKIESHDDVKTASFCGQVMSTTGTLFADPAKFVLKLGWCHPNYHNSSERTKTRLLLAKCYSALYLYPGCPVIFPLAKTVVSRHLNLVNQSLATLMYDDLIS